MILNVFLVVAEVIILTIKVLLKNFESIIRVFTAQERDVSGDVVLITGAGHGMGKEMAVQYSALGATVVCWDINEQLNLETVRLIKSKCGTAFGYT